MEWKEQGRKEWIDDLGPKNSRDVIIEIATNIINPNTPHTINRLARLNS